jgi:hypothetical protein
LSGKIRVENYRDEANGDYEKGSLPLFEDVGGVEDDDQALDLGGCDEGNACDVRLPA